MLERQSTFLRGDLRQDWLPPPADDGGISRAELTAFVRRHFLAIVVCGACGAFLAALYVAAQESTYMARTQILIDLKTPPLLGDTQGQEVETSLDTAEVESQMTVLRSDVIANMVIDKLDLTSDPEFKGQKPSRIEMIAQNAANFVAALGFFEAEQVDEWRRSFLRSATGPPEGGDSSVEENDDPKPQPTVSLSPEEAAKAEAEARRLTLALFQSKLGVNRVSVSYVIEISFVSRDPEKAAEIANATADAYLQEQLLSKVAAMEEGNKWLEYRLNELRRKLNAATQAEQAFRARHDYSIPDLPGTRTAVDLSSGVPQDGADEEPGEPTLEELEATADTYRKLYGSVLEAFTSSMQHKSYPYSLVRVITPASPPFSRSHPRAKITLAFGSLVGVLLGVGVAFIRQSVDGTIRTSRQVRSDAGADCLVEIPRLRYRGRDNRALAAVALQPGSPFEKALLRLKTAVRIAAKSDGSAAVGITSSGHGEGKTVIASNLGLVFAAAGYRTLVVDGDPRRGTPGWSLLPPHAAIASEPIQADLTLAGHREDTERYDLLSLAAMTSGRRGAKAHGPAVPWGELAKLPYDIIIVDLPPIGDAIDVLPAGPALDGLILLAEWGSTTCESVAEAVRIAGASGTPLLGVAITKVNRATRSHWRLFETRRAWRGVGQRAVKIAAQRMLGR